jgi:hypothetical protein
VSSLWRIPEGLRILPDGSWRVGDLPVVHPESLRYLKEHLVFDDGDTWVVDGSQRMPVAVEGPPFVVTSLTVDTSRSAASVVLDDGSVEPVADGALGMNEETGRFECRVRGGQTRAVFSRSAHQTLLELVEQEGGRFFLRAGEARLSIRA